MSDQKKSLLEFSVEQLDMELVARGMKVPVETRFEFKDQEGTPERHKIMKQVKKFYDAAASGTPNEELSHFSIKELLDALLIKTRKIKDKLRAIWVVDGRKDVFEIEDEQLLENANCTALICRENNLIKERGVSTLRVKNYGESFNLCDSEPFRQQPVLSGSLCTGFLVKEDIIATADHCAKEKM